MNLAREEGLQRVLVALAVAVIVTLVVWGSWILLAVILGSIGWLLATVGSFLQSVMDRMASARAVVGWIALGVGIALGGVLAYRLPPAAAIDAARTFLRRFGAKAPNSQPSAGTHAGGGNPDPS